MKYIKTIVIFSIIVSVVILNWYCQNETIQNIGTTNKTQPADYPPDGVFLTVQEYVKITPPDGDPFYRYLNVKNIEHTVDPYGYTNDNFTTPYAERYDQQGNHYQTQWFKYTLLARNVYTCVSSDCYGRYYIAGSLNYDHRYFNGTCTDCPVPGNKYCNWGLELEPKYLSANTNYSMYVGSDCIVDGKWQNW
jgi:hypothetical protein